MFSHTILNLTNLFSMTNSKLGLPVVAFTMKNKIA